ncbi:MAG TPA: membrane dipeptidase [Anaerolineaceae bacterium]
MFRFVGHRIERSRNRVGIKPPYAVQLEAFTLHQSLFVVDLHADALLWDRDLLLRGSRGHVDVPRLLSGNVALQVFGLVTKVPNKMSFQENSERSDLLRTLSVAQGWPRRTWRSPFQRALYQTQKLQDFAERSQGKLMRVLTVQDLETLVQRKAARQEVVGGFASLEGVHALEGKIENLDALCEAGVRMIGLAHFFDNQAAGSAHGKVKGGLTPFGREIVRRSQEKGMVIDLAHSSPAAIDDVLAISTAPLVVSHTGVRGNFESPRNLSDEHVRRIAATGGVIGIAMFKGALAEPRLDLTVQAMRYTADLVGVDVVGLGSDFDGLTETPVDASGLALLTEAMLAEGFTRDEIARIMGENSLRVLRATLPLE